MKIKILGCDGGSLPGFSSVSFLINDHLVLDAGSITTKLNMKEQLKIKHVLITHSHLDNIKDLCYLADNAFLSGRSSAIEIISSETILTDIEKHLFNGIIWPDMSQIPSTKNPTLKFRSIKGEIQLGDLKVKAIPVAHSHAALGYVLWDKKSAIIVSGDTGPTTEFWEIANQTSNLKAIFLEVSFPSSLEDIAYKSRHLTPATVLKEIQKLHTPHIPIYLYHLKPLYAKKIQSEVQAFKHKQLKFLKASKIFQFK